MKITTNFNVNIGIDEHDLNATTSIHSHNILICRENVGGVT